MKISETDIIITGGASGIGAGLVNSLKASARNIIVIDIDSGNLAKFGMEQNVAAFTCDLTNPEQTKKTIADVFYHFPDISILINNAGKIHSELMYNFLNKEEQTHSIQNWNKYLNVNLSSTFYTTLFVVEKMIQSRTQGLIINISSISAKGNAGQSVYSAAKAGVDALTVAWSKELSCFGIRTAGIAPGFFNTESTTVALSENILKKIIKEIPLRKLGELDDIEKAIRFIIDNDYFNGKIIELDGGLVLSHR